MSVPVRIPITVRWKDYPDAPKATQKSLWLGRLTCWPMLAVYGLIWIVIITNLITMLVSSMTFSNANMIAWISVVLFYWGFHKFKLLIEQRIAESAAKERSQS